MSTDRQQTLNLSDDGQMLINGCSKGSETDAEKTYLGPTDSKFIGQRKI